MSTIVFNPYNNRVVITQLGVDDSGRVSTLPPGELVQGYNYLVTTDLWPTLFNINCTTPSNSNGLCAISINDDTPDGTAQYWYSVSVSGVNPVPYLQAAAAIGAIIGAVVGVALCFCAAAAARQYFCPGKRKLPPFSAGVATPAPTSNDGAVNVTNALGGQPPAHRAGAAALAARPPSYPIAPPAYGSSPQPQQVPWQPQQHQQQQQQQRLQTAQLQPPLPPPQHQQSPWQQQPQTLPPPQHPPPPFLASQ